LLLGGVGIFSQFIVQIIISFWSGVHYNAILQDFPLIDLFESARWFYADVIMWFATVTMVAILAEDHKTRASYCGAALVAFFATCSAFENFNTYRYAFTSSNYFCGHDVYCRLHRAVMAMLYLSYSSFFLLFLIFFFSFFMTSQVAKRYGGIRIITFIFVALTFIGYLIRLIEIVYMDKPYGATFQSFLLLFLPIILSMTMYLQLTDSSSSSVPIQSTKPEEIWESLIPRRLQFCMLSLLSLFMGTYLSIIAVFEFRFVKEYCNSCNSEIIMLVGILMMGTSLVALSFLHAINYFSLSYQSESTTTYLQQGQLQQQMTQTQTN